MKKLLFTDLFLTAAIATVLTCGLSYTFIDPFSPVATALACLAVTLLMAALFAWPKFAAVFGALTAVTAAVIYFTKAYIRIVEYAEGYIAWISNWSPHTQYTAISVALLSVAVAAPVFLLVRYRAPALLLLLTGVLIFYGEEYLNVKYPYILFCIFLLLLLVLMCVHSTAMTRKRGLFALCAAPVCAALIAIGLMIPANSYGMGQDYFDSVIERFMGEGTPPDIPGSEVVDVGQTLGGPFFPSDEIVMRLTADSSMYLRGSSAAEYTGRRWLPDTDEGEQAAPEDNWHRAVLNQTFIKNAYFYMWTVMRETPSDIDQLLSLSDAVVTLEKPSNRLHTLPEDFQLDFFGASPARLSVKRDGSVVVRNPLPAGQLISHSFTRSPPLAEMEEFYRMSGPGFLDRLIDNYYLVEGENGVLSTLSWDLREQTRAELEYVTDTYLQLPETLPERLYTLANAVSFNAATNYDRARAIEAYLVNTFRYRIDMPYTPAGEDFVDYFIFTLKEGYCTYFATAMTVLCRAAGLPARYVEGFASSDETDEDGDYIVRAKQAHAWTEVYFEGVGWLAFEPTATFNSYRYNPGSSTRPSPTPEEPEPSEDPYVAPTPAPGASGSADSFARYSSLILFAGIFLALAAGRFVMFMRRKAEERSLFSLPYGSPAASRMYVMMLRSLRGAGFTPRTSETLREFAARVDRLASPKFMESFVLSYEKVCFAGRPLTTAESAEMRDAVIRMREQELRLVGGFRYRVYRYLLGII